MSDEFKPGYDAGHGRGSTPLPYQSPGAHQKSQWVTDDGLIGKMLVGCLIVASAIGAVLAAIVGVVWWLFTGW